MDYLENILSRDLVQRLGWTLVHFIWQAGIVALLLAILLKRLSKSSANLRYIAACLALLIVVLSPVITMNLIPIPKSCSITGIEPAPMTAAPPEIEQPANIEMSLIETFLPYIVLFWLVGVLGLSVLHLGAWAQLQKLRRRMVKPVDESLQYKLKELADILGINRIVQLMESALVQTPTVVGWLKPVILLPASVLTGFNADQIEAMLAHELAHIKRYDYLVNILQTVVEILGFFHPAVWWVSKRIRVERENCCDDIAVKVSGDSIGYAETLALFEDIQAGQSKLAVAASGGSLLERISRLIGKESTDSRTGWMPSVMTILLIMSLVISTTFTLNAGSADKPAVQIEREETSIHPGGMVGMTPRPSGDNKAGDVGYDGGMIGVRRGIGAYGGARSAGAKTESEKKKE